MKLFKEERMKHRIIGLIMMVSIVVLFLPTVTKQANRHLDDTMSLSLKLPEKPERPEVVVTSEKNMFESVRVAHVDIQTTILPAIRQVARNAPLYPQKALIAKAMSKVSSPAKPVALVAVNHIKNKATVQAMMQKAGYVIQLGTFTQLANAELLVSQLKKNGYQAACAKVSNQQGPHYKVLVGQWNQKKDALNSQRKIAEHMQLKGIIVKTGVS